MKKKFLIKNRMYVVWSLQNKNTKRCHPGMTTLGICSVHLAFMGSFVTHLVRCIHQAIIVGKVWRMGVGFQYDEALGYCLGNFYWYLFFSPSPTQPTVGSWKWKTAFEGFVIDLKNSKRVWFFCKNLFAPQIQTSFIKRLECDNLLSYVSVLKTHFLGQDQHGLVSGRSLLLALLWETWFPCF